jgi:diaminohydroxyphosphoribosylaminopyrimidine deaminase / 5-amino-6-(5-phosphoribosylamino)uracil reductase
MTVRSRDKDEQFLRHALGFAREGIGLASPNPYVGAVIVDNSGNIAGTGVYTYAGVKHAEVLALAQAGEKALGGTLYINLEPHSHQGRTPPCTDALISAGVQRVVACMADPNPKVSGSGFEKLRNAGVTVEVGIFQEEAQHLNEAFARYIRYGAPFVALKSAMSLDGKIATSTTAQSTKDIGVPAGGWITGEIARANVHEQRHQSDAILAGVGTILADDPLLTDRSGKARRRPLLRVILDSHLHLPLQSRLVQNLRQDSYGDNNNDVLVFCAEVDSGKKNELEARGVRIEEVSADIDGRLDLHAVLKRLGQLEITSVIIEGGATLNGAALAAGVVDKVFFYYAPTILGGGAVPFTRAAGPNNHHPIPLKHTSLHRFGEDIAIEGYLRDPYTE